jgi:hypothetical protein
MISTGDLLYGSYRLASLYTKVTDVLHTYAGANKPLAVLALLFSLYEHGHIDSIHALVNARIHVLECF